MEIKEVFNNVYEIIPYVYKDERGEFVKTLNSEEFQKYGLTFDFKEEYYSISQKNVLRGMHFQLPPYAHNKLVYCIKGKVLDVVVDLRKKSPNFGKAFSMELDEHKKNIIYIPKGFAHGFYALEEESIMVYKTSTVYNKDYDSGILWNSIDFNWPCVNPIVSKRDSSFESFLSFSKKTIF